MDNNKYKGTKTYYISEALEHIEKCKAAIQESLDMIEYEKNKIEYMKQFINKKYKGTETYTEKEALKKIEICKATIYDCEEIIRFSKSSSWIDNITTKKIDREETIQENLDMIEYEKSKIEYMKQFINNKTKNK